MNIQVLAGTEGATQLLDQRGSLKKDPWNENMIGTEKETSWESWFLEGGRSALILGEDCGNCRLQFLAVAFNHPLVIGKGVLFVAVEFTTFDAACIIQVVADRQLFHEELSILK